jgi:hypothetical protein
VTCKAVLQLTTRRQIGERAGQFAERGKPPRFRAGKAVVTPLNCTALACAGP